MNKKQASFLQELSPAYHVDKIQAKTFIIMDRGNVFIPYTEALHFAKKTGDQLSISETRLLPSGEFNSKLPLTKYPAEFWRVVKISGNIFREAF